MARITPHFPQTLRFPLSALLLLSAACGDDEGGSSRTDAGQTGEDEDGGEE